MKRGILLIAYGTATLEGRRVLSAFDGRVRAAFPGCAVRWAYSSELLRERLARNRRKSDSVLKALRKMCFERFEDLVLQPLQTIPGREYEDVLTDALLVQQETGLPIRVGRPLLATKNDIGRLASSLLEHLPSERLHEDHVIYMGHGSKHPAAALYLDLHLAVHSQDRHVHIGTMDGPNPLEQLLPALDSHRVWLMPLLATVGRHALHDMAGIHSQSWASRITQAGHECVPILKGSIEQSSVAEIWLDHLSAAVAGRQ